MGYSEMISDWSSDANSEPLEDTAVQPRCHCEALVGFDPSEAARTSSSANHGVPLARDS